MDYVSPFSTEIIHVEGQDNTIADALSRIEALDAPVIINTEELVEEQRKDEELQHILKSKKKLQLRPLH